MIFTTVIVVLIIVTVCIVLHKLIRLLKSGGYENKSVLITSCDSHVGKLLALRLDKLGFHVFAGCFLVETEEFLEKNSSHRLVSFSLDMSSCESIQNAFKTVRTTKVAKIGLWALINTSNVLGLAAPSEMYTAQDYLDIVDVNLFGAVEISRCFLPMLRKARGRIINTIHTSAKLSFTHSPYVSSMIGLEGYSDMLRRELYRQGVNVCIVQSEGCLNGDTLSKDITEKTLMRFNTFGSEVKQVYGGEFMQTFLKGLMFKEDSSSFQEELLEAYVSALTKRFPQTRYIVGMKTDIFMYRFFNFMPDWFVDRMHMLFLSM